MNHALGAAALAGLLAVSALTWAGDEQMELAVGGRMRSYQLHLPPQVGNPHVAALPLVVVLHGGGGNASSVARQTRFSEAADQAGFLAAFPNGNGRPLLGERLLTWNAGSCCGYAVEEQIDDIAFIRQMVKTIQRDHGTDPTRTFATGISNGGMLAYRLACEASDVFAAIAPVSAVDTGRACRPQRAVSVIHFHGSADQNVLLDGGVGPHALNRDPRPPVANTLQFWAQFDGCSSSPLRDLTGPVREERYTGCREGTEVRFYLIEGGGHSWPGGERMLRVLDAPSDAISATPLIWQFFASHGRTSRPP